MKLICRICNSSKDHKKYIAQEKMFGTGDDFEYFQCNNCGCLQISEIPINIESYYPQNYYSFNKKRYSRIKEFLKASRTRQSFGFSSLLGNILLKVFDTPIWTQPIAKLKPTLETSILDIGCGDGKLLLELQKAGFKNLTGIDPFLKTENIIQKHLKLLKSNTYDLDGKYDIIMLNHVLEHIPNQHKTLKEISNLLSPNGVLLIRIPIAGTYAWNKFKTDWVQLDTPRHFYLHTLNSFSLLASKNNFKITDYYFDSTEFQFVGSLAYQKNISLEEQNEKLPFSKSKIKEFKLKAAKLNSNENGDQAVFYLKNCK